jgi:hypothetical protein
MSVENLNLREALRQARERTNREKNRTKCRKYYRKRVEKNKTDRIRGNDSGSGFQ